MSRLFFVSCGAVALVAVVSSVESATASETLVPAEKLVKGASREQQKVSFSENGWMKETLFEPRAEPRRLDETICTVGPGAKASATVEIGEYTLQAKFQCGGSTDRTKFVPECSQTNSSSKCCTTDACTSNSGVEEIATHLGIKSGSIKEESNNYTVTLEEMPSDRSKKMYYVCNDQSNTANNKCVVTVGLPQNVPGPNACTLSKTVRLDIAKAAESVDFVCTGDGSSLAPQKKVYRFSGSACGTEEYDLTALLPEATLAKKEDGVHKLTVPKLPEKDLQLCYVCNYKNPSNPSDLKWKPCTIVVSVAGTGGSSGTSTTTPTTSSSARVMPRVLGLAACVTALFSTRAY